MDSGDKGMGGKGVKDANAMLRKKESQHPWLSGPCVLGICPLVEEPDLEEHPWYTGSILLLTYDYILSHDPLESS